MVCDQNAQIFVGVSRFHGNKKTFVEHHVPEGDVVFWALRLHLERQDSTMVEEEHKLAKNYFPIELTKSLVPELVLKPHH
jgi:hypothetical protein